jgi:hypothetical protein
MLFWHCGRRPWFIFLTLDTLISVTKMPHMRTYQSNNTNFKRCRSILLLQTSKTDNNALDINAIYNLKLKKT